MLMLFVVLLLFVVQSNTLGVLTKCDMKVLTNTRSLDKAKPVDTVGLQEMVGEDGKGGVSSLRLEPHGYVCVVNSSDTALKDTRARLVDQSLFENKFFFEENRMPGLVEDNRVGAGALVSRLNQVYLSHLQRWWLPTTLTRLHEAMGEYARENVALGLPECVQSDAGLVKEVSQAATAWLLTFLEAEEEEVEKERVSVLDQVYASGLKMLSVLTGTNNNNNNDLNNVNGGEDVDTWAHLTVTDGFSRVHECVSAKRSAMESCALLGVAAMAGVWVSRLRRFLLPDKDHSPLRFTRFAATAARLQASFEARVSLVEEEARTLVARCLDAHFNVPALSVRFVHTNSNSNGNSTRGVGRRAVQVLVNVQRIGNDLLYLVCDATSPLLEQAFREVVAQEVSEVWTRDGVEVESCRAVRLEIAAKIQELHRAVAGITAVFSAVNLGDRI